MEDIFDNNVKFKFENIEVENSLNRLKTIIATNKQSCFDFLCELHYLASLTKNNPFYFETVGFVRLLPCNKKTTMSFYSVIETYFNLSQRTVKNYLYICEYLMKFPAGGKPYWENETFALYTISKLYELTSLLVWQIDDLITAGVLTPKRTREQIRKIVARCKKLRGTTIKYDDYLDIVEFSPEEDKKKSKAKEEPEEKKTEEEAVTTTGVYLKFNQESMNYMQKVMANKKNKFKDGNDFINQLVKYAMEHKLYLE